MLKLVAVIYIIVGSMLAGSFVIAALTMDRVDAVSISIAAVLGALAAIPLSWFVAVKLNTAIRPSRAS